MNSAILLVTVSSFLFSVLCGATAVVLYRQWTQRPAEGHKLTLAFMGHFLSGCLLGIALASLGSLI